jgi:phosphoribosylanthranilate isomerase
MTRVKICGLTRPQDVECAIDSGASAVGFVFEPSSPRFIVAAASAEAALAVPAVYLMRVAVFGHYPLRNAADVDMSRYVSLLAQCNAVQSLDAPQMFHGSRYQVVRLPADVAPDPDAIEGVVLDTFDPDSYGGTGKTLDWELAAEFVRGFPKPTILAGGLTPENVFEAIRIVRPYGVDVSSGVESAPGVKDHGRIRAFLAAAAEADREQERPSPT